MCMEDVRIARETNFATRTVATINGTVTQFLSANPDRTGFIVCNYTTLRDVVISPVASDVTANRGLLVRLENPPLQIDSRLAGQSVQSAWFCTNLAGGDDLFVIEFILPRR